jgi:hypothetical protein
MPLKSFCRQGVVMKSIFSILIPVFLVAATLLLNPTSLVWGVDIEDDIVSKTVMPFLNALKYGDVKKLEYYISGELKRKKGTLLRENKTYSQTLRRQYRGVVFHIGKVVSNGGEASVRITADFPVGDRRFFTVYLNRNDKGRWMIIREAESF